MRIVSLDLRNIKSYGNGGCTVSFKPGVNLIWGENGSGKTTILEAIGFALFGALELEIKQFRRKGETESEVTLTLEGNDDRLYRVIRKIKASADLEIRDEEDGRKISKTREDAQRWLTETIGVEFAGFGRTLFENVLGVSQGRMVESFLQTPSVRKTIFEPVLRLEGYDRAWDHLGKTQSELNTRINEARQATARLVGQLEALPNVRAALSSLREQIEQNTEQLGDLQSKLSAQQTDFSALDGLRKQLDELEHQLKLATGKVQQSAQQLQNAQSLWQESQTAAQVLEESLVGYQSYQQAQQQRSILEKKQRERDELNQGIQKIKARLGELAALLQQIEAQLQTVQAAEQRILALQPDVERQEQLEAQEKKAQQAVEQRRRILDDLQKLQGKEQDLQASLDKVSTDLLLRDEIEFALTEKQKEQARLIAAIQLLTDEIKLTRDAHEEASNKFHALNLEEKTLKGWQTRFQELFDEIKNHQSELKAIESDLTNRSQAQQTLDSLTGKLEAEQIRLSTAQTTQDHASKRITELEERLALLQHAETAECPVCKKPLDRHDADGIKNEFDKEITALRQQYETAHAEEESAKKRIKRLKTEVKQTTTALEKFATADQQARLSQTILEKQTRLSEMQQQIGQRADVPERIASQQKVVQTCRVHLEEQERHAKELQTTREVADKEILKLSQKLSRLLQPARAVELKAEIKACQDEMNELQQQANALANAPESLKKAQTDLQALGNPREEQTRQRGIAARREELESSRAKLHNEQREQDTRLQAQQEAASIYAGLDQEIQTIKDCLEQTQADYKQYLSHEKAARALDQRQQELDQRRAQQLAAQQQLDEQTTLRDTTKQSFDPSAYETLRQQLEKSKSDRIRLETLIASQQTQEASQQKELTALLEVERQHQIAAQEVARFERLAQALSFVREGIHKAGPLVARRRVQAISYSANRIYRYILVSSDNRSSVQNSSDPGMLQWDETYEVSVRRSGEDLVFKQLSGGEKMAAAIAVRMALLSQVSSNLRLLFLDEPTANMDDTRRNQLAEQITRLEGLNQLFVITHDDAFERSAHHVLQVYKDNDISKVEVKG